jgi:hypothetical protein
MIIPIPVDYGDEQGYCGSPQTKLAERMFITAEFMIFGPRLILADLGHINRGIQANDGKINLMGHIYKNIAIDEYSPSGVQHRK